MMDLSQHLNHMAWISLREKDGRGSFSSVSCRALFDLLCCAMCCRPPVWCVSSYMLPALHDSLSLSLSLRHVKYPSRDEGKELKGPENSSPFLPQPHPSSKPPPPFSHLPLSECGKRFLSILKSESARHSRPSPPPPPSIR
jgi:hypothetical protein